jgi:hypothetical protein
MKVINLKRHSTFKIIVFFALFALLNACTNEPEQGSTQWALGSAGSGQSHISKFEDSLVISWLEPLNESIGLYYQVFDDELNRGTRNLVASGDDWFVNWADFPSVTPINSDLWVSHWLVYQEDFLGYDARYAVSSDGGQTWSQARTLHENLLPVEHGFVEIFPINNGFAAVWLDGENYAIQDMNTTQGTILKYAEFDIYGNKQFEQGIDTLVCDCCQPDISQDDIATYIVYRDRSEQNIRDIKLMIKPHEGQWGEVISLPDDNWFIEGCPVNGPSLASSGQGLGVSWYTNVNDIPKIRFAYFDHQDNAFTSELDVEEGAPWGYVDTAYDPYNDNFIVSWLRSGSTGVELVAASIGSSGMLNKENILFSSQISYPLDFPKIEIIGDKLVATWTDFSDGMTLKAQSFELNELSF